MANRFWAKQKGDRWTVNPDISAALLHELTTIYHFPCKNETWTEIPIRLWSEVLKAQSELAPTKVVRTVWFYLMLLVLDQTCAVNTSDWILLCASGSQTLCFIFLTISAPPAALRFHADSPFLLFSSKLFLSILGLMWHKGSNDFILILALPKANLTKPRKLLNPLSN